MSDPSCEWCFARVPVESLDAHRAWHRVNKLHAPDCHYVTIYGRCTCGADDRAGLPVMD